MAILRPPQLDQWQIRDHCETLSPNSKIVARTFTAIVSITVDSDDPLTPRGFGERLIAGYEHKRE